MRDEIIERVRTTLEACRQSKMMIATAESCTGGLIAGSLTEIAGSSDVFERGFVTYSNEAKSELLGVPSDLIANEGAVSKPVAAAMAEGALTKSNAHIAVAVTGVAGPGGGTADKPVGLVHIAAASKSGLMLHHECRFGNKSRREIRELTVLSALDLVRQLLDKLCFVHVP